MNNLKIKTTAVAFALAIGSVFAMPFLTAYYSTNGVTATSTTVDNACTINPATNICTVTVGTQTFSTYDTPEHAIARGTTGILRKP